jgi:hypothetical protein
MIKDQIDLATMTVEAENWAKELLDEFLETWSGGIGDATTTGNDEGFDERESSEFEGAGASEAGASSGAPEGSRTAPEEEKEGDL